MFKTFRNISKLLLKHFEFLTSQSVRMSFPKNVGEYGAIDEEKRSNRGLRFLTDAEAALGIGRWAVGCAATGLGCSCAKVLEF